MQLATLDLVIIGGSLLIVLGIGVWSSRSAGTDSSSFFLSSRNMPWWLLGVSMVATTFSADTPNLVTDIVRKNGVSGNWAWWAFLLTGMLTVFVYARMWRRSECFTDLEFYELRYSGKPAAFLRGFRALYLGVLFNVLVMASVCLAGAKIGSVLLGISPEKMLVGIGSITILYSVIGGLRGVVLADFFQFFLALVGAIGAAYFIVELPEIGSLDTLFTHERVQNKLQFFPDFGNYDQVLTLLVIPIAVQWWSVWYPGSEPGGGGYIAQRMLATKNEHGAMRATFLFNLAHYALRPWPWIIVALASLIIYPDLETLQAAFPDLSATVIDDDIAYPAMLTTLPHGLLGLVVASLLAALMSTLSTHLNWGSSYVCHDFVKRFIHPEVSEKALVKIGQLSMVMMMILAAFLALQLGNALTAFNILLTVGAGTGLIYILRWFWWRINAYSEIAAMLVSFLLALYFEFAHQQLGFTEWSDGFQLVFSVGFTTVCWMAVTFMTRPTDTKTLWTFFEKIQPAKRGWRSAFLGSTHEAAFAKAGSNQQSLAHSILGMTGGVLLIFSALFTMGSLLYGHFAQAGIYFSLTLFGIWIVVSTWRKMTWK